MKNLLRALGRTLVLIVIIAAAILAPFALFMIKVVWPVRREDYIVSIARAEDAPVSPTPHLEVRAN